MITDKVSSRFDKILTFLSSQGQIETGLFEESAGITYEDGGNVLQAATDAEFGIGQPMRSWLREWFDENQSQIESQLSAQVREAYKQDKPLDWAFDRLAIWAQADIQKRIAGGIGPGNSPETIAKKGFDSPLIHTGQLRSAIVSRFKAL